ncbi:MAG TPA: hemerythrin domain-containing protein [Bacilli bacterium]
MNWEQKSYPEIIDHIVNEHHAYLYETLPGLSQYSERIRDVHGSDHPELTIVHRLFLQLKKELEEHMEREEKDTFPAVKRYASEKKLPEHGRLTEMAAKLAEEHDASLAIFKKLRELTNDFTLPADACPAYEMVFTKMQELEAKLKEHIRLEDEILFARLAQEINH